MASTPEVAPEESHFQLAQVERPAADWIIVRATVYGLLVYYFEGRGRNLSMRWQRWSPKTGPSGWSRRRQMSAA